MHYESELRFLCDVLKKCRIKVSFASPDAPYYSLLDDTASKLLPRDTNNDLTLGDFLNKIKPYTIYKLTTSLKLCYMFLLLPQVSPEEIMIIGPYLSDMLDSKRVLELGEKYGLPPKKQPLLEEYYSGLPILPENSKIFVLIETFGERLWGGQSGFSVVDVNRELFSDNSILSKSHTHNDTQSLMVNMELMQKRYDFENELIRAVSLGQEHKVALVVESFSEMAFEKRLNDPVRNLKNYCIIMNTLLRKAAEQGGVHPLYINDISSVFANKIEKLTSTKAISELMGEMYRGYCRLVRKHSMKNLSPTVQKVIILINSDLSANLTLSNLAKSQNLSAGYLSAVFKKETGKTLTEYIQGERVELAIRLLTTTNLQIQTIALHCGIMDMQYFSKIFKKHTGKTPKEYRRSMARLN